MSLRRERISPDCAHWSDPDLPDRLVEWHRHRAHAAEPRELRYGVFVDGDLGWECVSRHRTLGEALAALRAAYPSPSPARHRRGRLW